MTVDAPLHAQRRQPQMFAAPRRKPQDPASEVGFFLSRERETRGLSLEAAAEATGIHPYHLDAIELGDLTRMPPRMEALEMIAHYAHYLGFETEPLIEHLLSFLPPPPVVRQSFHPARPPVLASAKVLAFGKLPKIPSLNIRLADYPGGKGGVMASVAAVLMLCVGVHFMTAGGSPGAVAQPEQVAMAQPAPQAQAPVAVAPKATVAPVPAIPAPANPNANANAPSQEDADALGALMNDQGSQVAAAKPAQAPAQQQVASAAPVKSKKIQDRIKPTDNIATASTNPIPQPSEGRVYGSENKDAHVVLKATAPVWLRIEDQQGMAVMTQMLNTGDTYMVPNRDGLVALTRDGGRLAYAIDGQDKGTLGPPGKILVNESLSVSALSAKH